MKNVIGLVTSLGLVVVAGCSVGASEQVPGVEDEALDEQQIVYSTNADGTWSANAATPSFNALIGIRGSATFTGPFLA